MSDAAIILAILGTLLIGVISPGPSFVLVSRIALSETRLNGLAAALGMGIGGAVYGGLALAGLTALLQQVSWLYFALRLAGGLYLLSMAVMIWRHAAAPLAEPASGAGKVGSMSRAFRIGLVTQLSNPKTAVVYASIFAAFLPTAPSMSLFVILPPLVFLIETTWYAVVAVLFSSSHPRALYRAAKTWIDRVAGTVIGGLGVVLIVESAKS